MSNKYTDTDYELDQQKTVIYKHAKAYVLNLTIEELKKMGLSEDVIERFKKRMRVHND